MTERQIINLVETTLIDKMITDSNYIKYSFFEVNVKYAQEHKLSSKDIETFLQMLRTKLESKNYKVFLEGETFKYKGTKKTVQRNEVLIAIKAEDNK